MAEPSRVWRLPPVTVPKHAPITSRTCRPLRFPIVQGARLADFVFHFYLLESKRNLFDLMNIVCLFVLGASLFLLARALGNLGHGRVREFNHIIDDLFS